MKRIYIGSRVRIGDEATLRAALRQKAGLRPAPGQMRCAGRELGVVGYRRGDGSRSLYALQGAPGLWPAEWIDPI